MIDTVSRPKLLSAKGFPFSKQFFVLDEDVIWDSGVSSAYYTTVDQSLCIIAGVWYIKKGVSWDGITNFWDGPEDPLKPGYPITWLASLIHDLGCMYWNTDRNFPYSRFTVDKFFFQELRARNFKYSWLYYLAVSSYTIWTYIRRSYLWL